MSKTIEGDLILTEDTTFDNSIVVRGNIRCEGGRFSLKVLGNIDTLNIKARDISAWDIAARDIAARDIDAWDIDAWDIDARIIVASLIVCEKLKLKKDGKVEAYSLIENRSKLERKVLREAKK